MPSRKHQRPVLQTSEQPAASDYDTRKPFEARLAAHVKASAKPWAQRLLWLLIAAVGWLTRTSRAAGAELRPGNPAIRRILVIRVDLIGDAVLSLPAVRALQRTYPDAEIDL